jgi:hypothetical protein
LNSGNSRTFFVVCAKAYWEATASTRNKRVLAFMIVSITASNNHPDDEIMKSS